jgi:hypothetical protein
MPKKYFRSVPSDGKERDSIGGVCIFPADRKLPCCRICAKPMILFFQFDLPAELGLPFQEDSHLSMFMCPEHNEIPSFNQNTQLPPEYWLTTDGHWYAALDKPGSEVRVESPHFLKQEKLELADTPEDRSWLLSVGGEPDWIQDPEQFTCSCGAEMHFICQLNDGHEFPKLPSAPEQPDSSSANDYVLFLGNEVYVFACVNQCNPNAVWVTVQN